MEFSYTLVSAKLVERILQSTNSSTNDNAMTAPTYFWYDPRDIFSKIG